MDEFPCLGTSINRKENKKKIELHNIAITKDLEEKEESRGLGRNNYLRRTKMKDVYCLEANQTKSPKEVK